jgi:hypothetical protein
MTSSYQLYYSWIKILVDAAVHSEHGKVIQCEFKPGSVERSIELDKEGKCPQFLLVEAIHITANVKSDVGIGNWDIGNWSIGAAF